MFCNRNLDQVVLNCLTYLLQFLKRTIKWIYEVEIRMESRVSRKKDWKKWCMKFMYLNTKSEKVASFQIQHVDM